MVTQAQPAPPLPFDNPVFGPAAVEPAHPPGVLNEERTEVLQGKVLLSLATGTRWELIRVIRECLYGAVVQAARFTVVQGECGPPYRQYDPQLVAVKVLLWDLLRQENQVDDPRREVAAMQYLDSRGGHRNVMSLTEVISDGHAIYVIMPFFTGGELFGFVASQPYPMSEDELTRTTAAPPAPSRAAAAAAAAQARIIFRQVANALAFLHRDGVRVVHRDVSLENCLLQGGAAAAAGDGGGGGGGGGAPHVVVMDFGMALRYPSGPRGTLMTPHYGGKEYYMSPEVVLRDPFSPEAIDVWAAGIILLMLLTGRPPPYKRAMVHQHWFAVIAVHHDLQQVLDLMGFNNISPAAVDLMQGCLKRNHEERYTTQQICSHPWVVGDVGPRALPERRGGSRTARYRAAAPPRCERLRACLEAMGRAGAIE
ncbi:kinase-like domain-containing protein [Tribonema minus]|uniref:Kinase-like domain-containing protein n=1 Tax=Tribonema minus TaxID=303371 RepID=A0A835Z4F6_9STRA|nr:kinase-like domain-containing protein [Tribonema minus]